MENGHTGPEQAPHTIPASPSPDRHPSFIIPWPTSHHAPGVSAAGNPMSPNASEASTQNDTQRHQPPFTAKRTTVTTDRKADAEAGHRRCSSQDSIPSEISQCGASAIAAHCIGHRSTLHQHLQHTAPGTPAICHTHRTRYPETAQQACHQVSIPLQPPPPLHLSHFKSIPLPLPDRPHHSHTSTQNPPSSPPTSVRLPTRNCRFTYPPLPSHLPTTATRFLYPASRPATAHKKPAPNPVKIVL